MCHIRNCIKTHTHMYIHKSQALPSKHLQFKPAKQTLLFTVTATYLPPEMGQAVFWRSLPYRFPAQTADHLSGQSLAAGARAARRRRETRKSSRSSYLLHCPSLLNPAWESSGCTEEQEGRAETFLQQWEKQKG